MTSCDQHTPCPDEYMARSYWMERMHRTHRQIKCDGCGLYMIWIPRKS